MISLRGWRTPWTTNPAPTPPVPTRNRPTPPRRRPASRPTSHRPRRGGEPAAPTAPTSTPAAPTSPPSAARPARVPAVVDELRDRRHVPDLRERVHRLAPPGRARDAGAREQRTAAPLVGVEHRGASAGGVRRDSRNRRDDGRCRARRSAAAACAPRWSAESPARSSVRWSPAVCSSRSTTIRNRSPCVRRAP